MYDADGLDGNWESFSYTLRYCPSQEILNFDSVFSSFQLQGKIDYQWAEGTFWIGYKLLEIFFFFLQQMVSKACFPFFIIIIIIYIFF